MSLTQLGLHIIDIESGEPLTLINRNALLASALLRGQVESIAATDPPGDSVDGDLHFVPSGATDGWAGQDGNFAVYSGGWLFLNAPSYWAGWSVEDGAVRTLVNGAWS